MPAARGRSDGRILLRLLQLLPRQSQRRCQLLGVGASQRLGPVPDARLDPAQDILVSVASAFLSGSFRSVALSIFFHYSSIFRFSAAGLSLQGPSRSDLLQLGQLLIHIRLHVRSLLAPMLVDPLLRFRIDQASLPELKPTIFRMQ